MASEMRRMAKALVETRQESYRSRHPLEESKLRVDAALASLATKASHFERSWRDDAGSVALDVRFSPAPATRRFLQASSIALTLLVACAAWALIAPGEDRPVRFLVPLAAAFGVLAFPFVVVALGSQREAQEARIRKALARALTDEDESRADRPG
jgi:hypothetical protein